MRFFIFIIICCIISGCSSSGRVNTAYAVAYPVASPIQCVPYARQVSGIEIYGNAHTWWYQAEPEYSRGHLPREGAVLVLAPTSRMRYGHVAVVTRVINARHIDVTHSNWGSNQRDRSVIYELMRVEDVSPQNDWSSVRFWNYQAGSFGFPYKVYGFIYNHQHL